MMQNEPFQLKLIFNAITRVFIFISLPFLPDVYRMKHREVPNQDLLCTAYCNAQMWQPLFPASLKTACGDRRPMEPEESLFVLFFMKC